MELNFVELQALLVKAQNSLAQFESSKDESDHRNSQMPLYRHIRERLDEIGRIVEGRLPAHRIGPFADARNLYWDDPETTIEEQLLDDVFALFRYLRERGYGLQR